jgi:hypothetical protein
VGCRRTSQEVAGRCRVASSKNGELGRRDVLPPGRQCPSCRLMGGQMEFSEWTAKVVALPRVGGLHHQYA